MATEWMPMTGVVFLYVLTARVVYKVLSVILYKIINNQYYRWNPEEEFLIEEQKCLVLEQQQVSPQDEFPKYARLQRKIDHLKEKLAKNESTRKKIIGKYRMCSKIMVLILIIAIHISFLLSFRMEPVIVLPKKWFYPFHKVLSFPTVIQGAIGLPCWMVTCNKLIERFII